MQLQALNNGLLIDPHDQQGIANALLKLLSEKNLRHEYQRNGWKNIHRFSWPEHCRTYLTRVASCRMRHPTWKTDTPADEMPKEDSLNDSLQDLQDASLLLSIDGDGGGDIQEQVKRVMSKMKKPASSDKFCDMNKNNNNLSKYPMLRKRQKLVVIAVDCYDSKGEPERTMISVIEETFKAIKLDSQWAEGTGVAISTAMPLSELTDFLKSGKIKVNEFDALVCSGGSEIYYPGTYVEDGILCPDPDYASHVEYRWKFDGVKKTLWKLMNAPEVTEGKSTEPSKVIEEDVKASNPHCLSYMIKNINKVKRVNLQTGQVDLSRTCSAKRVKKAKKVDDLRQKFRMRGLRCHLMYCQNSTRLQVLFVRWRLNVANVYVILGETGDTDYEELVPGTHKTIIIKEVVKRGSEELIRTSGSYLKEDVVPGESPLVAYVNRIKSEGIASALIKVSKCDA
ncbi:putative sucrose-phosphate synthase 2 [Bidens hawaiensis]|uniref:putative sucrose-phosphate synthase 2 n=1 Tax=Bidens hawaiensis TaxID=980011 RepID=UPI00404B9CA4